jgi:hypothetical protein
MHRPLLALALLLVCISMAVSQSTCPMLVEIAQEQVDKFCDMAVRNQACYGNVSLTAKPQADVTSFTFEQTGDIVDVSQIQSMTLAPMDEVANVWGVALMRLQADIPDTLPGQNVTFLMLGDVQIENAVSADDAGYTPMQAFYLETGIGDSGCEEAPESGVLVQTPDGVEEVTFNVNGVDVEIGSTVLLQAQAGSEMIISTVEGAAVITLHGQRYPAVAGTRLRIPLDSDLRPAALPGLPEVYGAANVRALPVELLPRQIEIAPPLADASLTILRERLTSGLAPCGVASLPECVHALRPDASLHPWAQGNAWGEQLPPRPETLAGNRLPDGQAGLGIPAITLAHADNVTDGNMVSVEVPDVNAVTSDSQSAGNLLGNAVPATSDQPPVNNLIPPLGG